MDLLRETIDLAKMARVNEADIKSIGLSWRWYLKVRDGDTPNPGVLNVEALRNLALAKLKRKTAA